MSVGQGLENSGASQGCSTHEVRSQPLYPASGSSLATPQNVSHRVTSCSDDSSLREPPKPRARQRGWWVLQDTGSVPTKWDAGFPTSHSLPDRLTQWGLQAMWPTSHELRLPKLWDKFNCTFCKFIYLKYFYSNEKLHPMNKDLLVYTHTLMFREVLSVPIKRWEQPQTFVNRLIHPMEYYLAVRRVKYCVASCI